MRTLLFGEAAVDLVCERPVATMAEADVFTPHVGGIAASIAVTAARRGAPVALAGGSGEDAWGSWLRARLIADDIDLGRFAQPEGAATPVSFVTVDAGGRAARTTYGDPRIPARAALGDGLMESVDDCAALVLTAGSLVDEDAREPVVALRDRALAAGRPVVFVGDVDLARWRSASAVMEVAVPCLRGALLVTCTAEAALHLTAEHEVEAAAATLLAAGAQHVVVTLEDGGALLRGGGMRIDAPPVPAQSVDPTGAPAALTGVLVARLAATGYYPPAIAAGLGDAVQAAARATEHWGAIA
jgi:sugar/nucleoside kinase (ribokinase family)